MCSAIYHFNLHFRGDRRRGATFHKLICHPYVFFGEVPGKVFCSFFIGLFVILLLSFKNSLYGWVGWNGSNGQKSVLEQ